MRKIVHRLRQKPPHTRRYIALGLSALIVGGIGVVWVTTLPVRFARLNTQNASANQAAVLEAIVSDEPQDMYIAPDIVPQNEPDVTISDVN
ncbi:hypothetical protein KW782_03080 [Candidatus Parcubacteria bacterium]|nr:hypothetical protein [Candidatus Parcubacteria bacterium]